MLWILSRSSPPFGRRDARPTAKRPGERTVVRISQRKSNLHDRGVARSQEVAGAGEFHFSGDLVEGRAFRAQLAKKLPTGDAKAISDRLGVESIQAEISRHLATDAFREWGADDLKLPSFNALFFAGDIPRQPV